MLQIVQGVHQAWCGLETQLAWNKKKIAGKKVENMMELNAESRKINTR